MSKKSPIDYLSIIAEMQEHLTVYSTNSISHFFQKGFGYLLIFILWVIGIGFIVLPFVIYHLFPFHILSRIENTNAVIYAIGSKPDVHAFGIAIRAILFLVGILWIIIAMLLQKNIHTNSTIVKSNSLIEKALEVMQKQNIFSSQEILKTPMQDIGVIKQLEAKDLPPIANI
jgi:hypothetical protein